MTESKNTQLVTHPARMPENALEIAQEVYRLFHAVSLVCEELGCACLAQRFRGVAEIHQRDEMPSCPSFFSQRHPTLHLLVMLAPLTRALGSAGFYDLALQTTELAVSFEPTLDLDITRAYLLVVLGENDEAWRIYNDLLQRRGSLPAAEVRRLAELARTHPGEEDISELYGILKSYLRDAQSPGGPASKLNAG